MKRTEKVWVAVKDCKILDHDVSQSALVARTLERRGIVFDGSERIARGLLLHVSGVAVRGLARQAHN